MPDTIILHPTTGLRFFGLVQEKKVGKVIIPGAPIVLKRGKQSGSGGFGVKHIWARHEKEVRARGYASVDDVPMFVADIVRPGSPIYCEFATMRGTTLPYSR
ncbi:UNVERIFIED_ORG: hypothetical protein M2312_004866 [Rhizobium esperanzae]|nr:hypothetical protein [Rhizobium esperanzae]